ncbi:MAG: hypothetical protein WCT32_04100 [Patescibacteria group bacterium]|jgi:dephospho-CoA kinase
METKNIFLYGSPGSGKTTISEALQKLLQWDYLELDKVRHSAQTGKSQKSNPFLFYYTTTAWQAFGELTNESAIKGLLEIRKALQPFVLNEIKHHDSPIIAEAAFLDPNVLLSKGSIVLVACPDTTKHHNQFFVHRPRCAESETQFKAACFIDQFLLGEAKSLGAVIYDNSAQPLEEPEIILQKIGMA